MSEKINITRFKKLARFLRLIVQTEIGAVTLLACITIIANIIFLFLPKHIFELSSDTMRNMSISSGGMFSYKFILAPGIVTNIKPLLNMISWLVMISAVLIIPISYQLALILKTIENGIPFSSKNSKSLYIIGRILLSGAFLLPLGEYIAGMMIINIIKQPEIAVHYSFINFTMLLAGILVLILASIFKYGNYLQQEYDATL